MFYKTSGTRITCKSENKFSSLFLGKWERIEEDWDDRMCVYDNVLICLYRYACVCVHMKGKENQGEGKVKQSWPLTPLRKGEMAAAVERRVNDVITTENKQASETQSSP